MAGQDFRNSIRKLAQSEPRPSSKLGAVGSIAWLSVLAGVIVAEIVIVGGAIYFR